MTQSSRPLNLDFCLKPHEVSSHASHPKAGEGSGGEVGGEASTTRWGEATVPSAE